MPVSPLYQQYRKTECLPHTEPPRLSAQDHSQKSGTPVHSMDSEMNANPSPFFKLPAELRNKIYRLVVITGQSLEIKDMHLQEFKKSQDNGTYRSRSTYMATDHVCGDCWPEVWQSEGCMFKDIRFGRMKTTYTLGTPHSIDTTTTTMLSLNKEFREEVAFIFYGGNTFHFTALSSLVPFMRDRTEETRKYIQRVWLTLTVDDRDWCAIFTEYGRPATWNTAFSSLVELPNVIITKLCVEIDDRKAKILMGCLNLRSRSMLWLHKLSKLQNLEMLGLEYDFGGPRTRRQPQNPWGLSGPTEKQVNNETEQELWRFLAPKMLKKEADDHDADALQQRRIWDFSHTRKQIAPDHTGHHSESDSDDEW